MSYEIVKRLRIENGEVFITSDSNNVFPKYYVERKNTYEPILTGCKVLTTTRAKKALNKLINAGYNAKMMLLNNKIILIYKN